MFSFCLPTGSNSRGTYWEKFGNVEQLIKLMLHLFISLSWLSMRKLRPNSLAQNSNQSQGSDHPLCGLRAVNTRSHMVFLLPKWDYCIETAVFPRSMRTLIFGRCVCSSGGRTLMASQNSVASLGLEEENSTLCETHTLYFKIKRT